MSCARRWRVCDSPSICGVGVPAARQGRPEASFNGWRRRSSVFGDRRRSDDYTRIRSGRIEPYPERIDLGALIADGLVLTVCDTGRGIDPLDNQRIFEPFEHGERIENKSTPGVGLGLAVVRDLVAALGGRVTLTSEQGIGSTFTVTLPLP
jgi:hypothetical protein